MKKKRKRVRENDEKYVSAVPARVGRGQIYKSLCAVVGDYVKILREVTTQAKGNVGASRRDLPSSAEMDRKWVMEGINNFESLILRRLCCSHLTWDEYSTLRAYSRALWGNILSFTNPEYYKFEQWANDLAHEEESCPTT